MKKHISKKSVLKILAPAFLLTPMLFASASSGRMDAGMRRFSAETGSVQKKYHADFNTYEELEDAGSDVAVQIAGEGATLLKNDNKALPLLSSERNVTVFGSYSTDVRQAGGGAGGGSSSRSKTLSDSLDAAGFNMNPFVKGYYKNLNANTPAAGRNALVANEKTNLDDLDKFSSTFSSYSDAAIVVVSRSGSEMRDITINAKQNGAKLPGHDNENDHSMMLEDGERALIKYIKDSKKFGKIIILLNTPAAMEISELADDKDIDSILWIGLTGAEGIMATGKILNGSINPSGRTVDIYNATFDTDPTWFNVSNNLHTGSSSTVLDKDGNVYAKAGNNHNGNYASLDYEEGIYMGYRFYETAGGEGLKNLATKDMGEGKNVYGKTAVTDLSEFLPEGETDYYYNRYNGVLYPFGYGLSYTTFDWELLSDSAVEIKAADKNKEIKVSVKVTNTGDVAGKDVVELYSDPTYYDKGIEKASKNMISFAKTTTLQPGQSQILDLSFTAFDLASFDDVDANKNGFKGYELEAGTTKVYLSRDSHVNVSEITYNVAEDTTKSATHGKTGITWDKDPTTGKDIKPLFSNDDKVKEADGKLNNNYTNTRRDKEVMAEGGQALSFMSRSDFAGTFPDAPTVADLKFSDDAINMLDGQKTYFGYQDKETDPWYKKKSDIPSTWTQLADTSLRTDGKATTKLYDMSGVGLDDTKWVDFMNQLTYSEMVDLVSSVGFKTIGIDAIDKPQSVDSDGASQLGQNSTNTYWPAACLLGATYNVDLAEQYGIIVGNESIFTNRQGWYAPSMNIHRSPFSGRNFEYYSQDGVQSGLIASKVVSGVVSKGVVVFLKHLALNDQEQNRQLNGGVITWASEQSMREIYLRPYEYSIKEGKAQATMTSFNRIGMLPSACNYSVFQSLLADEWGFEGYSITDMYAGGSAYWPGNLMVRCGTNPLGTYSAPRTIEGTWDKDKNMVMIPDGYTIKEGNLNASAVTPSTTLVESPTTWYWVRQTAMKILKVAADSNLMANGNRPILDKFTEGTTVAIKGGFGTSAKPEVRKDLTGFEVGKEVTDFSIGITDTLFDEASVSYTVTDGQLPDGLSLDAKTGAITGTPTKAGEFKCTLTATISKNHISSDKVVKFVVTGTKEEEKTEKKIVSVAETDEGYKITFDDGSSIDVKNGKDGAKGDKGDKGDTGATGAKGEAGEKGEAGSGCSGSIAVAGSAIAALGMLGFGLVLKKKKEEDK